MKTLLVTQNILNSDIASVVADYFALLVDDDVIWNINADMLEETELLDF